VHFRQSEAGQHLLRVSRMYISKGLEFHKYLSLDILFGELRQGKIGQMLQPRSFCILKSVLQLTPHTACHGTNRMGLILTHAQLIERSIRRRRLLLLITCGRTGHCSRPWRPE
jgi:hypothetical protein